MKKEEMELKEVIKVAILEAFAEMYGVATVDEEQEEDGEGDKKKDPIRPLPNPGTNGFSLR